MTERIPDTEEVREAYVDRKDFEAQIVSGLHADDGESTGEFNAWLERYASKVLDEFFEQMEHRNWSTSVSELVTARNATLRKLGGHT